VEKVRNEYYNWLQHCIDPELVLELNTIKYDQQKVFEQFSEELKFGTGGMRGILGVGPNRMNIYTIRRITKAFALFLKKKNESKKIVIGFDSRKNSKRFAYEAADVLLACGFEPFIFSEIIPTPIVSFVVREFCCAGGIMVTASHNAAFYNGFKVFGPFGTQLKDADTNTISKIAQTVPFFFGIDLAGRTIKTVPSFLIDDYFKVVRSFLSLTPLDFRLVYTPLNGVGNKPVKNVLSFVNDLLIVPEQEAPDSEFKTCKLPNPEDLSAWKLALKLAQQKHAQLVLATDPDCDRIGVAERNGNNYHLFSGNDIGVLLLDYLCKKKKIHTHAAPFVIKSIVTTNMVEAIAKKYGLTVYSTLTGFKNICGKMDELAAANMLDGFVLAFEESFGYLCGTHARDKDGVLAAALVCEMAGVYYKNKETLLKRLERLYEELGFYLSFAESFVFEGAGAMEQISKIMQRLRAGAMQNLAGLKVIRILDYKLSKEIFPAKAEKPIDVPYSDVLIFYLEEQTQVIVRPSGTEPKLKLYYLVVAKDVVAATAKSNCLKRQMKEIIGICEKGIVKRGL
jgi:phosphoglucomutase